MTLHAKPSLTDRLADVYPPYAAKMAEYRKAAKWDADEANTIFAQAQEIAKSFYAGVEYGRERPR